jgi:hypothetical protein
MNNIKFHLLRALLLCVGTVFLAMGCTREDDSPRELASKTTLTLSKYYNDNGGTTLPVWAKNDKAGMFVADQSAAEAVYATPILPGSQKSLFLFTLDIPQNAVSTAVAFWPSDADLSCANGTLKTVVPTAQTGSVTPLLADKATGQLNAYDGCSIELKNLFCTMYVSVKKGNYSVGKAVVKANGGEAIAGELTIDVDDWSASASEQTITVTLPAPLDCTKEAQQIPVMIAPVTLSQGYTVTLTDTDGNSFSVEKTEPVILEGAGKHNTDEAQSSFVTELIFCGDNMVYMIDAGLADNTTYKDAVTWSWDATGAANVLGLAANRCNHLDDCKPVDNGKKLLCTSSYGWCVLLDISSKEVLFHTTAAPNAHSAEILPDNRIVVACSEGSGSDNNSVQLYDISQPNRILFKSTLNSAHGVVWNETTQRLYAIGGKSLQIYKLKNWDTATPSLELEKTITTPQSGLHDMTYVNSNTLCIGGNKAYLYDIGANQFTEMTLFAASTAIKSINYNDDTGELWYTDSTNPEGSQTWSTQTIRYATDKNASTETRTIKVPDLDMYKVRVMNW